MSENVHGIAKSDFSSQKVQNSSEFQNRAEIHKGTPCAGGNGPILMEIDQFYTFPMDPTRSWKGGSGPDVRIAAAALKLTHLVDWGRGWNERGRKGYTPPSLVSVLA